MPLTSDEVISRVNDTAKSIIDDIGSDVDTDRETLIERLDEENDTLFGNLVRSGRIDQYDVDDLVSTAGDCAAVIHAAEQNAWVEGDNGLWEGLTYGVLASIAFFSLRNLLYQAMKDLGIDSNDDMPFAKADAESVAGGSD
mgnify:CR=1 FL=1